MNLSPGETDQMLSQLLADTSEPKTQDEPLVLDVDQGPSLDEEIVNTVNTMSTGESAPPVAPAPAAVNSITNQFVPAIQPGGVSHDDDSIVGDMPLMVVYQIREQQVLYPVVIDAQPTPNPDAPSTSKKRKMYLMPESTDPTFEKRRRAAINSKNQRKNNEDKLNQKEAEIEKLRIEHEVLVKRLKEEMVSTELCHQQEAELKSQLNKKEAEIEELRIENEDYELLVKSLKEEMVSAELRHQQEAEELKRHHQQEAEELKRHHQQEAEVLQREIASLREENAKLELFNNFLDNFPDNFPDNFHDSLF